MNFRRISAEPRHHEVAETSTAAIPAIVQPGRPSAAALSGHRRGKQDRPLLAGRRLVAPAGGDVGTAVDQRRGRQAGTQVPRHLHLASWGLVVVSIAAAGCDSSAPRYVPPSSIPGASTPALRAPSQDPRTTAETAAIAAYRGMWQAYAEAGETADPQHPALRKYTSGDALQTLTRALRDFRTHGEITKGRPVLQPRIESATGNPISAVRIRDCADSTSWLTYKKTGGLADNEAGGRRAIGATVKAVGAGEWKVSSFGVREVGSC